MFSFYRYHTGISHFSEKIPLVLVCGIRKWYGKKSDYNSSFAPCLDERSPPMCPRPKSHHYRFKNASYPPVNYRYMSPMHHPSINYMLKITHMTPIARQTYLYPPLHHHGTPAVGPLAHFSRADRKWYIPEKVVCIPLLIKAGKHSDYAPGAIPVKREHCRAYQCSCRIADRE